MATLGGGAPLPEKDALVEDPRFQEFVQWSRSLVAKILISIPDTHAACIHTETLKLNSSENAKLGIMAANIGISSAPVLKVVSEDFPLETSLRRMVEGLQLHQSLLDTVSPRLENKDNITELLADIRDLIVQINKMLNMVLAEAEVLTTPTPVSLQLPAGYEVQVATHLTLVQLQAFGQDMDRCLRNLDKNEKETS